MNQFEPAGTELARVLFTGNHDFKRVHYFAGVYIVELTNSVTVEDPESKVASLLGGIVDTYPMLRNAHLRYLLDDDILVILDTEDGNLVMLRDEHIDAHPDMDMGIMINADTLNDVDFEALVNYTPTLASDNVLARIGGSDRPVDYSNFTLCYSSKHDIHTLTIQGGVVVDFLTLK